MKRVRDGKGVLNKAAVGKYSVSLRPFSIFIFCIYFFFNDKIDLNHLSISYHLLPLSLPFRRFSSPLSVSTASPRMMKRWRMMLHRNPAFIFEHCCNPRYELCCMLDIGAQWTFERVCEHVANLKTIATIILQRQQ